MESKGDSGNVFHDMTAIGKMRHCERNPDLQGLTDRRPVLAWTNGMILERNA
jgi:hypothetical protein